MLKNKAVAAGAAEAVVASLVPDDSINTIGSVISNSARQNVLATSGITGEWTSSGPWTTYYHSWSNANSITQGFNMFMGDGYPNGTNQKMYVNDGPTGSKSRVKEYAHGNRLGTMLKDHHYLDNTTSSYAGVSWRCTPVRNTTDAAITRDLTVYLSSTDTNYGGCSIAVYTPDSSTYAAATGGTWSTPFTGGSNTPATTRTGSIVIPANTTVLVFTNSIHDYQTTSKFKDTNMLYGLDVFFAGDLLCDLRMLETLATARLTGSTNQVAVPHELYTVCATQQGDR